MYNVHKCTNLTVSTPHSCARFLSNDVYFKRIIGCSVSNLFSEGLGIRPITGGEGATAQDQHNIRVRVIFGAGSGSPFGTGSGSV